MGDRHAAFRRPPVGEIKVSPRIDPDLPEGGLYLVVAQFGGDHSDEEAAPNLAWTTIIRNGRSSRSPTRSRPTPTPRQWDRGSTHGDAGNEARTSWR